MHKIFALSLVTHMNCTAGNQELQKVRRESRMTEISLSQNMEKSAKCLVREDVPLLLALQGRVLIWARALICF